MMSNTSALTISADNTRRKKTTERLPVILTDAELLERGKSIAIKSRERAETESAAKAAAEGYKLGIKGIDGDIRALVHAIDTGREMRNVEIEVVHHYDLGEVVTTRTDTGEFVRSRAMSWDERQTRMDIEGEEE